MLGQLIVPPASDLLIGATEQNLRDVAGADAEAALLLDAEKSAQELLCERGAVERLTREEAVVTGSAVLVCVLLAEIGEELSPKTAGALGAPDHLVELLARHLSLMRVGNLVEEAEVFHGVAVAE